MLYTTDTFKQCSSCFVFSKTNFYKRAIESLQAIAQQLAKYRNVSLGKLRQTPQWRYLCTTHTGMHLTIRLSSRAYNVIKTKGIACKKLGMSLTCALLILVGPKPALSGSVDSGIAPYERCALCHGLFGNTTRSKFPKLAGQNPKYLELQIQNFLSGRRTNDDGQMATVVTEIDTSEIPEIVNWFATQVAPDAFDSYSAEGDNLYQDIGCGDCHNEQSGSDVLIPLLASQHPEYLTKQLLEIRDGIRSVDSLDVKRSQLQILSDTEIESIANYLASLERK